MTREEAESHYREMRTLLNKLVFGAQKGADVTYMRSWYRDLDARIWHALSEATETGDFPSDVPGTPVSQLLREITGDGEPSGGPSPVGG